MKYQLFLVSLLSFNALAGSGGGGTTAPPKWHEADYVDHHCKGEVEHVLSDRTRVDCLSETHAIEYDWGKKWAEAIGQSLYYAAMTGKKAGIVLIVNPRTKDRYLKRLNKAIEAHSLDIDVWTIEKH
jgi:hypothetical protein